MTTDSIQSWCLTVKMEKLLYHDQEEILKHELIYSCMLRRQE